MAGKRYSAGAIFLQVVPVFANVQRAIEDEAKNIDRALGDQMERSGEKAGDRAGVAASKAMKDQISKSGIDKEMEKQVREGVSNIDKALGDINTRNLGKKLRAEVKAMQAEMRALGDVDLSLDVNAAAAATKVAALKAQIEDMRSRSKIFFDIKGLPAVYRGVAQAQKAIDGIDGDIKLDVDTQKADRKMGGFEKRFKKTAAKAADHLSGSMNKEIQKIVTELKYLENLRIGIDISGNRARAELKEIRDEIEKITRGTEDIDLKTDAGAAFAELKMFDEKLDQIDRKRTVAKVKVDVDKKGVDSAGRSADDAANSFRSFSIIALATASIGPALIPMLAGIAGGLLALGPAAAVAGFGLASVGVGFSGLGDALGALQQQQDAAATNAVSNANKQKAANYAIRDAIEALQDAYRNAARAAEDAAERVSDARRSAARAAEDAAEAVSDARESAADALEAAKEREREAQEDYLDSVNDVAEAEQALRDAREAAQKKADTIAQRQRKNAADERQAVLDLFEAQTNYNAVMADGAATDTEKEQASVDLEFAQIDLNDVRGEQADLAAEAADYAQNGVEGAEEVQDAQDALTEALKAQTEAQKAVAEAAKESDEARKEGAEDVAEALRDQQEVLSDSARAIAQALEDQRESASDSARAIEDAKEALRRARESATDDLGQIDASAQAVKTAFDKLGPAGAKFALFLFSLREGFRAFRDEVQTAMLPAVQTAIEGFLNSSNATKSRTALVELARSFGAFTGELSKSFQGEAWGKFFDMLATTGTKIMDAYGGAFISIMEAFASILTTAAPFALRFAEGLEKMMNRFADWAASKKGADAIKDFIAYVEKVGPAVIDFFGSFVDAAIALGIALAPYGEQVLKTLTAVFDYIANMDKDTLGAIATGITVLVLASQMAYLVMNVMMAGAALFASTVGIIVFAAIGIGIALAYLYKKNEKFRDFVDEAWVVIRKAFTEAWYEHIKPALENLWDALQRLWKEALEPFFEWLGPKLLWLIEHAIPLFAWIFEHVIKAIVWWIENMLIPGLKKIGEWWGIVVKDFKDGKEMLKKVWKDMKDAWGKVEEFFEAATDRITESWETFLSDMRRGRNRIVRWWNDISGAVETSWLVIQSVWDTIIDTALPALETAFDSTIAAIGRLWDGLQRLVGTPIKFVIEKVLNEGLIAGFNEVASWVGRDGIDDIKVPEGLKSFATGGIMPGYTPGRDPHKFVSPTGGRLELSGGEAVMRPEFTAAVGPGFVNTMNSLAMSGGVSAVRKAMGYATGGIVQAFAKGGKIVFPVPGGYVNRTAYNLGHDGMDINHPSDATGKIPFYSATSGRVTTTGYSRGYGNAVFVATPYGELVYGHAVDGSLRVGPGAKVAPGTPLANIGNTGNSQGAHLHFGFPGGTFYGAEALLQGAAMPDKEAMKGASKPRRSIPSWLMAVVKDPLGAFKGWVTDPIKDASSAFADSELFQSVSKVPAMLGKKVVDKVWDIIPGWVKTAGGWADKAADWTVNGVKDVAGTIGDAAGHVTSGMGNAAGAVGNALGLATGGILPYNGTMMYDSGGYLPPGLTSVMNLTGKPEPVFTADQFDGLGIGGENFHYEPHFHKSDLTSADVVDDLDFHRRKAQRAGRYERNKA